MFWKFCELRSLDSDVAVWTSEKIEYRWLQSDRHQQGNEFFFATIDTNWQLMKTLYQWYYSRRRIVRYIYMTSVSCTIENVSTSRPLPMKGIVRFLSVSSRSFRSRPTTSSWEYGSFLLPNFLLLVVAVEPLFRWIWVSSSGSLLPGMSKAFQNATCGCSWVSNLNLNRWIKSPTATTVTQQNKPKSTHHGQDLQSLLVSIKW